MLPFNCRIDTFTNEKPSCNRRAFRRLIRSCVHLIVVPRFEPAFSWCIRRLIQRRAWIDYHCIHLARTKRQVAAQPLFSIDQALLLLAVQPMYSIFFCSLQSLLHGMWGYYVVWIVNVYRDTVRIFNFFSKCFKTSVNGRKTLNLRKEKRIMQGENVYLLPMAVSRTLVIGWNEERIAGIIWQKGGPLTVISIP